MSQIVGKLRASPMTARVAPFIIFALLTSSQAIGGEWKYWIYLGKSLIGAWLLWAVWPVVAEMRWKLTWEAIAVGILVFVMWVGIDPYYKKFTKAGDPWNPFSEFGAASALAWAVAVGRIVASSLVVPPMEEMFYRSFVYRYIINPDFDKVPLNKLHWPAFLIMSIVFGFVHREWLAGILCGMAYGGLVVWKGRLGDAMTAHGITNFLLGIYVVYKGAWQFW